MPAGARPSPATVILQPRPAGQVKKGAPPAAQGALGALGARIVACKKCPRLSAYVREVARARVRRHASEEYWGRPLPGFGDPRARLLVVGLAPAAHGGNRTGRMFTGDSSGDWLARAMHAQGLASQPTSESAGDGLALRGAYVTAAVRCAPPDNRPSRGELDACRPYLGEELAALADVRAILCLGRIAHASVCRLLGVRQSAEPFAHGRSFRAGRYAVVCSYHPSRQNTQTGRLSREAFESALALARRLAS